MKRSRVRVVVLVLALGGVCVALVSQGALDRMRRDYVALRYLQDAFTATREQPVNRPLAVARMSRALELSPDQPMLQKLAPGVYVSAGAYDRAFRLLSRQAHPDTFMLGYCLLKLGAEADGAALLIGSTDGARELHRQGLITDRQYALQMNNAGYVLADAGVRLQDARAMIEMALAILPLDPNVVDSMGWVYYRLGESRKAVFYLERAVRLQGSRREPELHYHLGAAYAREGRFAPATRHLRIALQLDPYHPHAQKEMDRLQWLLPTPMLVRAGGPEGTPNPPVAHQPNFS